MYIVHLRRFLSTVSKISLEPAAEFVVTEVANSLIKIIFVEKPPFGKMKKCVELSSPYCFVASMRREFPEKTIEVLSEETCLRKFEKEAKVKLVEKGL